MDLHILSIGYGRQLFDKANDERARLVACAHAVGEVHHIVFTRKSDGCANDAEGRLFLYPTNSSSRLGMVLAAVRIGLRLIESIPQGASWRITAQDPLASGLVGYILRLVTRHDLIVQEHGDIFGHPYWREESIMNQLWYPIAVYIVRHATRVRAVSERVAAHLEALGVPRGRIVILPVYTDLRSFMTDAHGEDLKKSFPDASVIVLSVARLVPQKNIPLLLKAFAILHGADIRTKLVVCGDGGERDAIEAMVKELHLEHAVILRPWSRDIVALMQSADIYALSSNYEGWGRVLVEAMASGLPSVTTDVGCVGEVCVPGVHSVAVPVGDVQGFGAALVELAIDEGKRASLGAAGRERAKARVQDIDTYARRWAELFSPKRSATKLALGE